jgi:hypothetical protein
MTRCALSISPYAAARAEADAATAAVTAAAVDADVEQVSVAALDAVATGRGFRVQGSGFRVALVHF